MASAKKGLADYHIETIEYDVVVKGAKQTEKELKALADREEAIARRQERIKQRLDSSTKSRSKANRKFLNEMKKIDDAIKRSASIAENRSKLRAAGHRVNNRVNSLAAKKADRLSFITGEYRTRNRIAAGRYNAGRYSSDRANSAAAMGLYNQDQHSKLKARYQWYEDREKNKAAYQNITAAKKINDEEKKRVAWQKEQYRMLKKEYAAQEKLQKFMSRQGFAERRAGRVKKPTSPLLSKKGPSQAAIRSIGGSGGGGAGRLIRGLGSFMLVVGAAMLVTRAFASLGAAVGAATQTFSEVEVDLTKGAAYRERYASLHQGKTKGFDDAVALYSRLSGNNKYLAQSKMASIAGNLNANNINLNGEQLKGVARALKGLVGIDGVTEDTASNKLLSVISGQISPKEAGLTGVQRGQTPGDTLQNILNFLEKNSVTSSLMKEDTLSSYQAKMSTAMKGLYADILTKYPANVKSLFKTVSDRVISFFGQSKNAEDNKKVIKAWAVTMATFQEQLAKTIGPHGMAKMSIALSEAVNALILVVFKVARLLKTIGELFGLFGDDRARKAWKGLAKNIVHFGDSAYGKTDLSGLNGKADRAAKARAKADKKIHLSYDLTSAGYGGEMTTKHYDRWVSKETVTELNNRGIKYTIIATKNNDRK